MNVVRSKVERAYRHLGRDNALNFIRLVLAILVIVDHSYPIGGLGPDPALGDLGLGSLAVGGFFAISGYLITKSRFNSNLGTYALNRALRILPGYWACLVFTAFMAAGAAGLFRGGWTAMDGLGFFVANVVMVKAGGGDIGSTLAGLPYPGAWNGSLWTLRYEVLCYLVVGLALAFSWTKSCRIVFPLSLVAVTVFSLTAGAGSAGGVVADLALLTPFFLSGACLYVYGDTIPCNIRWAAAALALFVLAAVTGTGRSLAALPLSYLFMWFGVAIPRAVGRLAQKNDFSYGAYLYAFPVQQLLAMIGVQALGTVPFILFSIVMTVPLAVLSWFLVEKPAIRLAKRWKRQAKFVPAQGR